MSTPPPVPQPEAPEAPQPEESQGATPEASGPLMLVVIAVLGSALLALVGGLIALAVENIAIPSELNTLTSLIAGGLVGFLTPHATKALGPKPDQTKKRGS